jgi:hypothetical protein
LASAFHAPPMLSSNRVWERWATHIAHVPEVAPAGPHFSWNHHEAYSQLMIGLYQATRENQGIGRCIQRFVMRLGEDAFMPDLQCFRREWEWRPLALPIGPGPTSITFDQYITWCPEAKFELVDGKPHIGSWEGTRNVLGLLLMTFGLEEVVTLHHPREWVAALLAQEEDQLHDAGRRDVWWSLARQAAGLLHERFGVQRVAVIGDLARPEPLGFWSELTLVAWGLPKDHYAIYQAIDKLTREPRIEIRSAEEASPRQRAAFGSEAVDVGSDE